jgi:hypothetical protein
MRIANMVLQSFNLDQYFNCPKFSGEDVKN